MIEEALVKRRSDNSARGVTDPLVNIVLEKGQVFTPAHYTHNFKGLRQACYQNAFILANKHSLHYVEGFGTLPNSSVFILHAWCVDDNNIVVDPTWDAPENRHYMGVVLPLVEVAIHIGKKGYYGVLTLNVADIRDEEAIKQFFPEYKNCDWRLKPGFK